MPVLVGIGVSRNIGLAAMVGTGVEAGTGVSPPLWREGLYDRGRGGASGPILVGRGFGVVRGVRERESDDFVHLVAVFHGFEFD